MIIYIKQAQKVKLIYRIFNIFRKENLEDKTIIYLPINTNSKKRKIEKVMNKLSKYFFDNCIKNVVLEQSLMENEIAKNVLYSNNINILDGARLDKFLIYSVIQKIYSYKGKKIEEGEITILVNDNNPVNIENIMQIAQNIKRLNIITNSTKKFKKMVDYLYNELGILIKLSNNMKTNLNSSDIIINMDFTEDAVNKLQIPIHTIIINIPNNINIISKKFMGINIKNWKVEVPSKYKLEGFDDKIMYEASIYKKASIQIFEQIETENIRIKELIGVNGEINKKEFL